MRRPGYSTKLQIARLTLAQLCRQFGGMLKLPADLDGARLLWALAGNESSFGVESNPRHEAAYCHGGKYFDAARTKAWGCLAHCSFGAWQVMYANFVPAISPLDILQQPELVAGACVQLIQNRITGAEKATTIEEIADAYNSGDWRDKNVPEQYIADVVKNYAVPIGGLS